MRLSSTMAAQGAKLGPPLGKYQIPWIKYKKLCNIQSPFVFYYIMTRGLWISVVANVCMHVREYLFYTFKGRREKEKEQRKQVWEKKQRRENKGREDEVKRKKIIKGFHHSIDHMIET